MFIQRKISLAGLVLSAAFVAAGCGAEGGVAEDDGQDVVETGLAKDDSKRPIGTFVSDASSAGQLESLTLNANLTYEALKTIVCITTPCNPLKDSGAYHYSHSGSIRYLNFTGDMTAKYAYELQGDTLRLRLAGTRTWFSLHRDVKSVPLYCGGAGETRPRGGCPVGYSCNCPNGAYCFVAGTCSKDSTPVRCGNNTCTGGQVCCNPLMGICTPPGGFCIL